jgi:hypothetical protein
LGLGDALLMGLEVLAGHIVRQSTDGAAEGAIRRWQQSLVGACAAGGTGADHHRIGDARGESDEKKYKEFFLMRAVEAIVVE